jgi:hypothetical protein
MPLETENVYGKAVLPAAETVCMYGVPTTPPGRLIGLTVMTGHVGGFRHASAETVLEAIVTESVLAKALPIKDAPVVSVIFAKAKMFPTNAVPVPRVAELPTCQ